jgi:hypothetical protein
MKRTFKENALGERGAAFRTWYGSWIDGSDGCEKVIAALLQLCLNETERVWIIGNMRMQNEREIAINRGTSILFIRHFIRAWYS